jgi:hypothetical protein
MTETGIVGSSEQAGVPPAACGLRVAVTGHQPGLLGGYGDDVAARLRLLARGWMARERPGEVVSGMAAGWDLATAEAAIDLGIPLVAALACPGQNQAWPETARERFERIVARAALVHVMPGGPGMWTKRDAWVLARGEAVLALWSGVPGGTGRAIAKARKLGRRIDNLWPEWSALDLAA